MRISNQKSAGRILAWISVLYLMVGCAAGYGRFQMDHETGQAFKNYVMIDGYHYYYSGRENKPSAIIGIDPAFRFSSKFWTPIAPGQFRMMVDRMFPPGNSALYGANMLTPDGRKAGVWYSWVRTYSVKFDGDRIYVPSPEPFAEPDGSGIPRVP